VVVPKTIDNLKDRPKDEKKVVAGGIAITVIVVLLVAWAIFFLKKIQNGTQQVNFDSGAQSEFNFSSVTEAQQQIEQQSQAQNYDELYRIRSEAEAGQGGGSVPIQIQEIQGGADAFGNSSGF